MTIGAIIADFATAITLRRRGSGSTSNGRFTPGSVSTSTINASVTPATGRDLLKLPEGMRQTATIRVLTTSALLAGAQPDEVAYDGVNWEVRHVAKWAAGGFYDCLAQLKAEG